MTPAEALIPEWRRLELLGNCVVTNRRGQPVTEEVAQELTEINTQVHAARAGAHWRGLTQEFDLAALDEDVLTCALGPEAEPHLGWMFQELQPGIASPYPTPALIRELFFMDAATGSQLLGRVASGAPLIARGLLETAAGQMYGPLRPSLRARERVLGLPAPALSIPGAIPVPCRATWSNLVLPEPCLQLLREFLLWVTKREQVTAWGGRVGGGPVALFAGPSGTGKTLAAEVLANELGWPLYRVDLGLLVSKYIGETEKNLNALFDAAYAQRVLLLFDEAESLFSKRGEVRDARDRYANMEVSHLLSRIERHEGPCVLTSNMRDQFDSAFARRFQVVIDFPRPRPTARAMLWRQHLPPRAPIEPDVDTDKLAACELTGGQIRNAATHAAMLAAGESTAIGLHHIASAVWTELGKQGLERLPSTLGWLAAYRERHRRGED